MILKYFFLFNNKHNGFIKNVDHLEVKFEKHYQIFGKLIKNLLFFPSNFSVLLPIDDFEFYGLNTTNCFIKS